MYSKWCFVIVLSYGSVHMHTICFTGIDCECVCVRVFWVLRCAVMQVYNSWTWAVKPQWSTGICKVSCSGFVIRCKKLTDPLRQEKSKAAGRRHSLFTDIYLWLTLITWILSRNGDGGKSRWERSVSQLFG